MKFFKALWANIKDILYYTFFVFFLCQVIFYIIDALFLNSYFLSFYCITKHIPSWFYYSLGMFIVAIKEEVIFRYLLMDCIFKRISKLYIWLSILISAIIFGMAHFFNYGGYTIAGVPQVIMCVFLGLILGKVYFKKGLWAVILIHAAFNIIVATNIYIKIPILIIGLFIFLKECFKYVKKGLNKLI